MIRLSMLGLVAFLLLPMTASAAPSADLWERWTAHDGTATTQVDHGAWDDFLARYLRTGKDGIARIDYGAVSDTDKGALAAYLAALAGTRVSGLSRPEQQAFWINLYNALTVQVILDHYPVDSIRDIDISPGFFSDGPWGKKLIAVEGETVSLDDIEHRILRPIWKDARIHYAVNCASIGCPNLQDRAFTADNTEALLDRGARLCQPSPRRQRRGEQAHRVQHLQMVQGRLRRLGCRRDRASEELCGAGPEGGPGRGQAHRCGPLRLDPEPVTRTRRGAVQSRASVSDFR